MTVEHGATLFQPEDPLPRRLHVGTDVGGTFTDLWVITDSGRQFVVKFPSTPDIISGILGAIDLASAQLGIDSDQFCAAVERFGHGTTAGLNALLTGRAAKTAVITTAGFRDTLEIGRLKRQVAGLTDLQLGDYVNRGRWAPVVPRHLVFEVSERIDRQGEVVTPLDEATVDAALELIASQGIEALAVCTLWSVANPAHEARIGELAQGRFPDMFVSLSHEVAPGIGEYARMSTTATNAALGPDHERLPSEAGPGAESEGPHGSRPGHDRRRWGGASLHSRRRTSGRHDVRTGRRRDRLSATGPQARRRPATHHRRRRNQLRRRCRGRWSADDAQSGNRRRG